MGEGGNPGHDTPSFLDPNMWIVIMHVNPNISTEYKQYVYAFLGQLQLKIEIIKFSYEAFVHFCGKILCLPDSLKKRIEIRHNLYMD